jgi:hypothetical protein
MAHYSRIDKIVIDVPEGVHDSALAFWQGAAGGRTGRSQRYPEYHWAELPGQEIAMLIQRLGDGPPRVHLDIHTDDLAAEVSRLERLGAQRVRRVNDWWIMADPAGLPFCVIPDPPGRLNDGNARRWD